MTVDWDKIEASKKAERARLAALPIGEKLHLLEAMRRRAEAIKSSKPQTGQKGRSQDQSARED
jgi:hypothetical protein